MNKNNWGGKRAGSGRKKKDEEQTLIAKLSPYEDLALEKLFEAITAGEKWAIITFFHYRFGKPVQRTQLDMEQQSEHTFKGFSFLPGTSDSDDAVQAIAQKIVEITD